MAAREIKEKLGLETYYFTKGQENESLTRSVIQDQVFEKMKNLEKKIKKDRLDYYYAGDILDG